MLRGMPISSLALLTALTASPSDASGARLKEKVMTGNWPWWFTVMGTAMFSVWLKALSGTWLAAAKTAEAGTEVPPKAVVDAVEAEVVAVGDVELCPALAEVMDDVPPETTPSAGPADPVPVRMERLRRSTGFSWNEGL